MFVHRIHRTRRICEEACITTRLVDGKRANAELLVATCRVKVAGMCKCECLCATTIETAAEGKTEGREGEA